MKKQVTDWLVYMTVRLILCFLQAMSLEMCYKFGEILAWVAYTMDRRHRKVAMKNISMAFPGRYSEAEQERLVYDVYRHFIRIIAEIAHIPRLFRTTTWENYITLHDRNLMARLLIEERPIILVTAHFGNWEMAGYILGMFGFKPYSVARTLDNPYLEQLIRSFRTRTGQEIIYKRGAFDQVSAVIEQKYPVGLLADQHAGTRGAWVDFFGREASSHKGPAMLALKHDAIICLGFGRRLGDKFKYEVWTGDVIDSRDYQNRPNGVFEITQRCTKAIEDAVRRAPEQYFWLHRRWRERTPDVVQKAA